MLMELGLITPPIGINLFVLKTIVPEVPLATIIRGIVPFVTADVGRITLLVAVPGLALWLPQLLFKQALTDGASLQQQHDRAIAHNPGGPLRRAWAGRSKRRGAKYAVVAMCVRAGMGAAG